MMSSTARDYPRPKKINRSEETILMAYVRIAERFDSSFQKEVPQRPAMSPKNLNKNHRGRSKAKITQYRKRASLLVANSSSIRIR